MQGDGAAYGVHGISTANVGVKGEGGQYGVYGSSDQSNGYGVYGTCPSGFGVYGYSWYNNGVYGQSALSNGVYGRGTSWGGYFDNGVKGVGGGTGMNWAGYFQGRVQVTSDLYVSGTKNFKIDHPLDPANKYLVHSCVESPDVMNIYNGNVTTDANGDVTVALPDYFEALNRDYRYQLTVIGQFAQAIVSEEVKDNKFKIKTDKSAVKVSWQVTGIRQDAYVKAHPMVVEQNKPANERGTYLHPELFGQPESKGIDSASMANRPGSVVPATGK